MKMTLGQIEQTLRVEYHLDFQDGRQEEINLQAPDQEAISQERLEELKQQQQQKQQQQEKQMSRADAQRILDALKNDEKNVQKQLHKKQVVKGNVEKDW